METNGAPIEYPTVTIDGYPYAVKFSQRALYRLDKAGIDLAQFGAKLKAGRISISMVYDCLAASIQIPAGSPLSMSGLALASAEDLVEKVPMDSATKAVIDAMGKVQPPAVVKLQEPAATEQLQ